MKEPAELLAFAATSYALKLAEEARRLKIEELRDIGHAVRDHTSIPEHHWQKRWEAEMRAKTAQQFAMALAEALREN